MSEASSCDSVSFPYETNLSHIGILTGLMAYTAVILKFVKFPPVFCIVSVKGQAHHNPVSLIRRQGLQQRSRRILAITMLLLYTLSALYWINLLVGISKDLHESMLLANIMEIEFISFSQCVDAWGEAAACRDVIGSRHFEDAMAIIDGGTDGTSRATLVTTISSIAFALSVCSSITIFMRDL